MLCAVVGVWMTQRTSSSSTIGPGTHGPGREEHSGAAHWKTQKDFMEEGPFAVGLKQQAGL